LLTPAAVNTARPALVVGAAGTLESMECSSSTSLGAFPDTSSLIAHTPYG
jgi:hypothetical protein